MEYVVSIKLKPDDEVTGAVKKLLDGVGEAGGKTRNFVGEFRESFRMMGGAVQGFRSELSALRGVYGALTGITGMGVRDLVQTTIDWNADMETLGLSMSTVLSSVDRLGGGVFAKFTDAQKEVANLFRVIKKEAAETPVEFQDIAQTFTMILPLVRKAMPDLKEVVKLSGAISTWDVVGGRRKGDTARDVRQILSGQMTLQMIQNTLLQNQLPELRNFYEEIAKVIKEGGDPTKQYGKLIDRIQTTLGLSEDIRDATANSFQGLKNAAMSEFKFLFVEGTNPIFGDLKQVLRDAATFMRDNPDKIRAAAKEFAQFVFKAGDVLYDVFKFFYDNWGAVSTVFLTFVKVWTTVNVIRFIGGLYAFAAAAKAGTFADFAKALAGFRGTGVPGVVGAAAPTAVAAGAAAAGTAGKTALKAGIGVGTAATGAGIIFLLADALDSALGHPTLQTVWDAFLPDRSRTQRPLTPETVQSVAASMGAASPAEAWAQNSELFNSLLVGMESVGATIQQAQMMMSVQASVDRLIEVMRNPNAWTSHSDRKDDKEIKVLLEFRGADVSVLSKEGTGVNVGVTGVGKAGGEQ